MTGIVIFPAGRDDAFEDYKRFVPDGHPIDDIKSYFVEDVLELLRTTSEDGTVSAIAREYRVQSPVTTDDS